MSIKRTRLARKDSVILATSKGSVAHGEEVSKVDEDNLPCNDKHYIDLN